MDPQGDEDSGRAARRAAFDALARQRDAARIKARHGAGRILGVSGRPERAEGSLLPDGTMTDAVVVALPGAARGGVLGWAFDDPDDDNGQGGEVSAPNAPWRVAPEACVWLRRLRPGGTVARRGRVLVEPDVALRFVDEPDAGEGPDEGEDGRVALPPSLERDLSRSPGVARRVASDLFAQLLCAVLCNTEWRHLATGRLWSCSWRGAGEAVAHLRGEGSYMDWYCSGGEGLVDEGVLREVEALGWSLVSEADGHAPDAIQLPETAPGTRRDRSEA